MKWITREHPKIDRIACPWLIRRFIDPDAEIIYVKFEDVIPKSQETGATPFDVPGVEFTHYGEECTFDYFLKKYNLRDRALKIMAPIIRGADRDQHHLAGQASGLWAISAGLAYNHKDDHELLEKGMVIYDALYSWAKYLPFETHTEEHKEKLLLEYYSQIMATSAIGQKIPSWAKELKELLQDSIDTNLTLKEISRNLDLNPAYLSREFGKYFDNMSFGDYTRKMRIDKALQLLDKPELSLSEIAYLTGFSDQSHFTRIFKRIIGESPSAHRKKLMKKSPLSQ